MPTLRALGLNCTLKPGDDPSSTDLLVTQVLDALAKEGVETDGPVRVADLDIKPGVRSDEGDGDEWPACGAGSWTPTSWCSVRRSGWGSRRRSPSG